MSACSVDVGELKAINTQSLSEMTWVWRAQAGGHVGT